jgi:hypothetical protein
VEEIVQKRNDKAYEALNFLMEFKALKICQLQDI